LVELLRWRFLRLAFLLNEFSREAAKEVKPGAQALGK